MKWLFKDPKLELRGNELVRRGGLLLRRSLQLDSVVRIFGVIRDAITYEEITIVFIDKEGNRFWVSEFDRNFSEVVKKLMNIFPGLIDPTEIYNREPFAQEERLLWSRSK